MTSPFIVYALPRSRTAWLSQFLSYGDFKCAHEQTRHLRSAEDAKAWLAQDFTGTAETAAAPFWRLVQHYRPDITTLVIRRPVAEVVDSIMALDMRGVCTFDRALVEREMLRLDRRLDIIEHRVPGALSVTFADLAREDVCARVFEHCLPYRHDPAWWAAWAPTNYQISMPALMRHFLAHQDRFAKAVASGKRASFAALTADRALPDLDGVTIQAEGFETFWRDGQHLFAQHATEIGDREGVTLDPNSELSRALMDAGRGQIVTARCNGRMFGYLTTAIGPSLEDRSMISATQGTFYVAEGFRGLGPRLQRASIEMLKQRGVGELFMRTPTRGAGAKAGALYRRMGAMPFGEVYCLPLRAA